MKTLTRAFEALSTALLVSCLAAPLVFFFARVRPWQPEVVAAIARPALRAALLNTITLALVTATLSTALAFVFSWLLWRFEWRGRPARALALTLKIPYLLPSFFLAFGWIVLAAPHVGYLNRLALATGLPELPQLYGLGGTIFVEVLWSTAAAMIQLQTFFGRYPGSLEDAAIICGASPARAFRAVTLPLARQQLLACWLLTALSAAAAFGVPAMLGAPARRYVLTTKIVQSIKSSHDFGVAGGLSLGLLLFSILLLVLQRLVTAGRSHALVSGKATRPAALRPGRGARALYLSAWIFGIVSCVLPVFAIALSSLLRDPSDLGSLTVARYLAVFVRAPDAVSALTNSIVTAAAASAVATAVGLVTAFGATRLKLFPSRLLNEAWSIGYALPGTVIALCLLVYYATSLADTLWILAVAYLVKYAAFALRTLTPAMASVGRELEEAAWMSGASPLAAFTRIFVPLVRPVIAAAAVLAFVPMLSELTMSVLLVGPGTETLGALIFRMQEYADPGTAAALAVAVTAAILVLNAVLKRLSKGDFGI